MNAFLAQLWQNKATTVGSPRPFTRWSEHTLSVPQGCNGCLGPMIMRELVLFGTYAVVVRWDMVHDNVKFDSLVVVP